MQFSNSPFLILQPLSEYRRQTVRQDAPPATAGGWLSKLKAFGVKLTSHVSSSRRRPAENVGSYFEVSDIKIFFSFIISYYFYCYYYYCSRSIYNCLGFLRGSCCATLKYIKNFELSSRHFCI